MRIGIVILVFIWMSVFICGCYSGPSYSVIPSIKFVSITPTIVHQNKDSVYVTFSFTDGDGDIGRPYTDSLIADRDAILYDNRVVDSSKALDSTTYRVPYLTPPGKIKTLSGQIHISVQSVYMRPGHTVDTLSYTILLKDRAGHRSNKVKTSSIIIVQ